MAVGAVLAAGAAVWITLNADFLAYPGWLALQKADFILGPVLVGLYWRRVRPQSRFGPLLIAFGAVGAIYILQSSSNPWLFGTGLHWESVIYLGTLVLILTFPTGRLDGVAAKLILVAAIVAVVLPYAVVISLVPQLGPDGSISGCGALCPDNALAITTQTSLAVDLTKYVRAAVIVVALATGALLVSRMVTGTPPQRRALAIGAPIALLFTLLQITYQSLKLVDPAAVHSVIQWVFAGVRSLVWYGFLFALIAAQLFAGRALHRLVRQSLQRPSPRELERMVREPLGDPGLRLAFWDPNSETWVDADAEPVGLQPPEPGSGRGLTIVERSDRSPAVAITHDAQLDDDPELLRAAGSVALLAAENAELDAAWYEALQELRRSRARVVVAGDNERREVERNLHDGLQQHLLGIRINLALASEHAAGNAAIQSELDGIGRSVDDAIDQLREVSHELYPATLSDWGLGAALEDIQRHATVPMTVRAAGIGRHSAELESAVYYCCVEAIQNAAKHSGPAARISVTLREDADELSFEVRHHGRGFDQSEENPGTGLQNMRDRIGALDGRVSIVTAAGYGTVISGSIPLHGE